MPRQDSAQTASVTAQRRKRERDQRYQNILTKAEELFCERGYTKTTMREIAKASELADGTVYLYFHSKEDLLIRLLDKIAFEFRTRLGEALQRGKTPMERFENVGLALSQDFWRQHRSHMIILFRESVGISLQVQSRRRAIINRMNEDTEAAILNIMREYGSRDRFAAQTMAMAIEGIFERIAYNYVIWEDRSDEIDAVVRNVMEFVGHGLVGILKNLDRDKAEKG